MYQLLRRHNLIFFVFLVFFLPGLLALIISLCGQGVIFKWMLPNYRLHGITKDTQTPSFDLNHVKSHEMQKYLDNSLTKQLPLRSLFIRLNNQIHFIFKKSYAADGVVIGKLNQLFEMSYIKPYCLESKDSKKIADWANKLKKISDFFEKRGKTFIYVITPSKAEYMPENIPKRFHCMNNGISPENREIEQLLKEKKVRYINGSDLMVNAMHQYNFPMFPKGGIHWNTLGATIEANAIIDAINEDNKFHLNQIQFSYSPSYNPEGQDHDLHAVLNLIIKDSRYLVPAVSYKKVKEANKTIYLACIGGSFLEKLNKIFMENKTFSKISYYRYFKLYRTEMEFGKKPIQYEINSSAPDLTSILAADVILLEENSSIIVSAHGELFFDVLFQQINLLV